MISAVSRFPSYISSNFAAVSVSPYSGTGIIPLRLHSKHWTGKIKNSSFSCLIDKATSMLPWSKNFTLIPVSETQVITARYHSLSSANWAQQTCPTLGFPITSSASPNNEYTAVNCSLIFVNSASESASCSCIDCKSFTAIIKTSKHCSTCNSGHLICCSSREKSSRMLHTSAYPKSTRLSFTALPSSLVKINSTKSLYTSVMFAVSTLEQQNDSKILEHSGDHWPSWDLGRIPAKLLSKIKTGISKSSSFKHRSSEIGIFSWVP